MLSFVTYRNLQCESGCLRSFYEHCAWQCSHETYTCCVLCSVVIGKLRDATCMTHTLPKTLQIYYMFDFN